MEFVRVRKTRLEDAMAIARIHVDTWRTTYRGIIPDEYLDGLTYESRLAGWERYLSPAPVGSFVAEGSGGEVVGFANCGPARGAESEYAGELYEIYVTRAMQGKGVGGSLFTEVARSLDSQNLNSMLVWVLAENPYRSFYVGLGGEPVRRKDITLGGKVLEEIGYGWPNLAGLVQST